MTRCESYPPCFGTIYFPTAPFRDIEGLNFYILVYRIRGFYKLFIYSLQSFRGQNLIYLGISHAL